MFRHSHRTYVLTVSVLATGLCFMSNTAYSGCTTPGAYPARSIAQSGMRDSVVTLTKGNADIVLVGPYDPSSDSVKLIDLSVGLAVASTGDNENGGFGPNWVKCSITITDDDLNGDVAVPITVRIQNNDQNNSTAYVQECVDFSSPTQFRKAVSLTKPPVKAPKRQRRPTTK